jgi:membrane associated rhomboid family serine protease
MSKTQDGRLAISSGDTSPQSKLGHHHRIHLVEKPFIRRYCPAVSAYLEFNDGPQPTRRWRWRWSVTITLVVINIVMFLFQEYVLPQLTDPDYFALSSSGLAHGFIWQLITYQFMHGGWMHLLLNCWALFMFGRPVEWAVGKTRFLILYFTGGIIGGLLQVSAAFLWPDHFGGASVGASAGISGVVAAFAMLFPEERLIMLLFFIIPINMRAKSLLWLILCLTALGISFYNSRLFGGNIAHFAHLGGILTGIAFTRFYFFRILPPLQPSL